MPTRNWGRRPAVIPPAITDTRPLSRESLYATTLNAYRESSVLARRLVHRYVWARDVPAPTGHSAWNGLDFVAIDLWGTEAATGQWHGHLLVMDREELQARIDLGELAGGYVPYLHRRWVVSPTAAGMSHLLPAGWGLMVGQGTDLRVVVEAPLYSPPERPAGWLAPLAKAVRAAGALHALAGCPCARPRRRRGTPAPGTASGSALPGQVPATEALVLADLRRSHLPAGPGAMWAAQVPVSTGLRAARVADAFALEDADFGTRIHGLEIKISRSDLLAELRDPTKSAAFFPYTDCWWLAVPDRTIVRADLPKGWGLLQARGEQCDVLVPAAIRTPAPLPPGMVAALMRAVFRDGVVAARQPAR